MPRSTGEGWLNVEAVAAELGIVTRTVYRLIDQGHLVAYKMGRVIRVRRSDLEAFVQSRRIGPGDLRHLYWPWTDDQGSVEDGDDDDSDEPS